MPASPNKMRRRENNFRKIDDALSAIAPRNDPSFSIRQRVLDNLRGAGSGMTFGISDRIISAIDPAYGEEVRQSVARTPIARGVGAALLPIGGPAVGAFRHGLKGALPFVQDVAGRAVQTIANPVRTMAQGTGAALLEQAVRDPQLLARARRGDPEAIRQLGLTATGGAIPGAGAGAIKLGRKAFARSVGAANRIARNRRLANQAKARAVLGPPPQGGRGVSTRAVARDIEQQMGGVKGQIGREAAKPRPPAKIGRPKMFKDAYKSLDRALTRMHQRGPVEPQQIRDVILEAGKRHGLPAAEVARGYQQRLIKTRGPRVENLKGIPRRGD